MMHVHLALVSEQMLPTLIPALMQRPDLVVLACSADMKARGMERRLVAQLSRHGIASQVHHNAPDTGVEAIRDDALNLLLQVQALAESAPHISLNATGGTKLMALGFVEALRDDVDVIFYTDTAHHRLEVLVQRGEKNPAPLPIEPVLKVTDYLAAQGFKVSGAASDDEALVQRVTARKKAAKYLGQHAEQLGPFIQTMNRCMQQALGNNDQEVLRPQVELDRVLISWAEALAHLRDAKLIDWEGGEATEFTLMSAEAGRFLKGGWLEEYAWHVVRDEKVFDSRWSVKGHWDSGLQANNEFDVLACHQNQLLFIECKTLSFTKGEEDSELAYKIDSLGKQARGLFGRTWLLSAREPSKILLERAAQARFDIVGPADLKGLRQLVRIWRDGPQV